MTARLSMICSRQSNGAYFAVCPEIKGCFTQGDTYEQAAANLEELVEATIRDELADEDIQEILSAGARTFSEFEVTVRG